MITGKTLIDLGYRPGKWFGAAIEHANLHALEGAALKEFLDTRVPALVEPHEVSKPFHRNIRAEAPEEVENVAQVMATMDALMKTPTLSQGAVMPDACPTGGIGQIPVGGVVTAENAIHPAMHSADICCSVMATNFGMVDPKVVLDVAHAITHFGGGGRKDTFELPSTLGRKLSANRFLRDEKSTSLATTHLGTQGDGNHFLFVGQSERTGETILVTHHGSRGLGAWLYRQGMRVAENFRRKISPKTLARNAWIPFDDAVGQDYWSALQLVREWTKLNHTVLHEATAERLTGDPIDRCWNEHNFVFRDGTTFYHAKGATPLDDRFVPDSRDGLRLVPLNMAEPVLVVRGDTTATNLGFAPHGAGRNVSRSAHRRRQGGRSIEEIFAMETAGLDVRFYSGEIDITELPSAYKNAKAVQDQMQEFGLGEVVDRILPYGCIMAGDWKKRPPWRSSLM